MNEYLQKYDQRYQTEQPHTLSNQLYSKTIDLHGYTS